MLQSGALAACGSSFTEYAGNDRFLRERPGLHGIGLCVPGLEDPASSKAAFYRTDPKHYNFAVFGASSVRAAYHAYESSCWNEIRHWADHLSNLQIKIWLGAGRHGPGNNLFFMFKDLHGHHLEISAEMEIMP